MQVLFEAMSPLGALRDTTGLPGVRTIQWEATYRPFSLRTRTAV